MNKSAASAAFRDYVKFQAVIKLLLAQSPFLEVALASDLITSLFFSMFGRASAPKIKKKA